MEYFVLSALGISLLLNCALAFRQFKKKHIVTVDAKAMLASICSGGAVLKIEMIDSSNLFFRSPRG